MRTTVLWAHTNIVVAAKQSMRGVGLLRFGALLDSLRVSMDHRVEPGGDDGEGTRDELHPPPRSETERGRGTMRSMVEGAFSAEARGESEAPSTALRAVPLPRFAGQDEDASGRGTC